MKHKKLQRLILMTFLMLLLSSTVLPAQQQLPTNISIPKVSLSVDKTENSSDLVTTLQILAIITVLALAPSILVMMTCFTRIIVVFHFLKQAIGTTTQPPTQVLTGLALFLTFFVMQPALDKANKEGIQPYMREEITQQQALTNVMQPFREFMLKHTREEDLGLFIKLNGGDKPKDINEVSTWTIIPAFTISELRIAFQIGFLLFVPFLVLDMIIASTLMSLGMFLLPPQLISMPIKILLFILVDGWYLIIDSLMRSIITP
ncbi:MAG: flagellar type III secretion system pore protein FliP [Ignavibacteriae bacterium]|nr:flagellar type III secretion system pore protein FliP [Ignavibacteriota bacterium]